MVGAKPGAFSAGGKTRRVSRVVIDANVAFRSLVEAVIPIGTWFEAHRLCRNVDPDDTAYLALALYFDALLWTEDAVLKDGLRAQGFARFFEP